MDTLEPLVNDTKFRGNNSYVNTKAIEDPVRVQNMGIRRNL